LHSWDWRLELLIIVPDCPSGKLEWERASQKVGSANKSRKERTATL
jgi:hypothetical protein